MATSQIPHTARSDWLRESYGTDNVETLVMLWEAKTGGKVEVTARIDRALMLYLWEQNAIALHTGDDGTRYFVTKNANR